MAQSADVVLRDLFTDPFFNLDTKLQKRLARLDAKSETQLAPEE